MRSGDLIETTCGATGPAVPVPFNVDTIDRYGNALPTIIISANQTINWKSRDYSDSFLSILTAPNPTKEAAIIALCDALVASGLIGKARLLNPFIGDNAIDNSLNLAYPFLGIAGTDRLTFVNSPIHGSGFLQGTGTQYAIAPISTRELSQTSFSFGYYSLTNAINTNACFDMAWGDTSGSGVILTMMNSAALGGLPFFGNNGYGNKIQANPANAGGLIMGHVSATQKKFTQGTTILGTLGTGLGLIHTNMQLGILAAGNGANPAARKLGATWVSDLLSVSELADLNTILGQFMIDKGVSIG